MDDEQVYKELLKIIKKYSMKDITIECYIKSVIDTRKKVLAHLYLIIDRYVDEVKQNAVFKKETKIWLVRIKMNSLNDFKNSAKAYIENKLKNHVNGQIDYSYTAENLQEYLFYVNSEWDGTKKKADKIIIDKIEDVKPDKKATWKDKQTASVFDKQKVISYVGLLDNFDGISQYDKSEINTFWNFFQEREKSVNKDIMYLYITYLVVPGMKLSTVINFIVGPKFNSKKITILDPKTNNINQYVIKKFNDFFAKYKEFEKYRPKHDYIKYIKFRFNDLVLKDYLKIKKSKVLYDVVTTLNQTTRNKINLIDKIEVPQNIEDYLENENGYFVVSDDYYYRLQKEIEKYINNFKYNNKTKLIEQIYKILHKMIKNEISKEIEIYYFD